jgi:anthrone oxygenase-like protein
MENVLKFLALLSSGMFTGAALYVTTVEHPARMSIGAALALQEFRPSYKRAAPQQAALAIVCFLCGVSLALLTQQWLWLLGGILVGAVGPFTLIFIMPTNRLLLDEAKQLDARTLESLLAKWARLHTVRTVLGAIGFLVLLWACVSHP